MLGVALLLSRVSLYLDRSTSCEASSVAVASFSVRCRCRVFRSRRLVHEFSPSCWEDMQEERDRCVNVGCLGMQHSKGVKNVPA